jgi:hypothetical protein
VSVAEELRAAARMLRAHGTGVMGPGFAEAVAALLEDDARMADRRGPQSTEGHSPGAVKIARIVLGGKGGG